jgi:hypothetical protein
LGKNLYSVATTAALQTMGFLHIACRQKNDDELAVILNYTGQNLMKI